jgi:hypothetical protein
MQLVGSGHTGISLLEEQRVEQVSMKPSKIEDQHILAHELSCRLQKLEAEQQATAEAEKRRLKELHWMRCPKCGHALATATYGPVEIDVCPSCRGLWLDANELETIVASESGLFRSCLKIIRRR